MQENKMLVLYSMNKPFLKFKEEEQVLSELSAFNQLKITEDQPVVQIGFAYGINDNLVDYSTANSATVTSNENMIVLSTGADTASKAIVTSKRFIKYRTGQGAKVMFTAVFSEPIADTTQLIGVGTADSGYFFGYVGLDFCILRRNSNGDTQVNQTNWNRSVCSWLNPLKGNVFMIQYQWLGFGQQSFSIENPLTGKMEKVHDFLYANQNESTSVFNPSFPIRLEVENTVVPSIVSLRSPSMAAFIEGKSKVLGPVFAADGTRQFNGTTLTNIITLRNKSVYKGLESFIPVFPKFLSVSSDGNQNVIVQILKNATVTAQTVWVDVNNKSAVEYNLDGTTVTGGDVIFSAALYFASARDWVLDESFYLNPGETITIAARMVAGGSNTINASINFQEDQ